MQKAILCHEFLHVRRHDWIQSLAEQAVGALFWFHPALWWLLRRIRLAREEVVDAEVLQATRDRKPYLEALLEMAAYQGRVKAFPAPLFLNERQLTERVALLLKEVHMPKSRLVASLAGRSNRASFGSVDREDLSLKSCAAEFQARGGALVKATVDAVQQWKFAAGPQLKLPATTSIALRFVLTTHNWSDLESDVGQSVSS